MPIFALYTGLLGLVLIYLSNNVVNQRKKFGIGLGDGGEEELTRAIRVHANFVEYVPFALILLAALEANQAQPWVLHLSGSCLLIARILHAQGLGGSAGTSKARFIGVLVTWLVLLGMSGYSIFIFVLSNLMP